MLISLTDLLSWRVRAGERRLALHDLLFEAETRRLVYVMVEPAGLAPGDRVLIAASALGVPEAEAQEMPLHLREDELDRAPRCGGGHDEMVAILAAMPPMAIGPFGAPSAPLLMPEHERPGEDEPDRRDRRDAAGPALHAPPPSSSDADSAPGSSTVVLMMKPKGYARRLPPSASAPVVRST